MNTDRQQVEMIVVDGIAVDDAEATDDITVSITTTGCGKAGCCQTLYSGWLLPRERRVRLRNTTGKTYRRGDSVAVAIAAATLRRLALVVYGLPVLGLLVATIIAYQLPLNEGWRIAIAITGCAIAIVAVKYGCRLHSKNAAHIACNDEKNNRYC